MRANPHLRVQVGCGYYHRATPYHGDEHMVAGLAIPMSYAPTSSCATTPQGT